MNWKNILALVSAFMAGAITSYALIKEKIKTALKVTISNLIDDTVDQVYPCKLVATIRYNQECEENIVDMSRYESLGTIGIIIDKKGPPANDEEKALDGKPMLYQTAVVYNLGGHWFWKVL